jgi:hypothetical protein
MSTFSRVILHLDAHVDVLVPFKGMGGRRPVPCALVAGPAAGYFPSFIFRG